MQGYFPTTLAFTLAAEGGYSDNKADPGRRTDLGITQATLDAAREHILGLPLDVIHVTRDDATRIYEALYWVPIQGDALPNWIALPLFDAAVNSGPVHAVKWLQAVVNVAQDGRLGGHTLDAVAACDPHKTLREFTAARIWNYMRLPNELPVFGRGWARRAILAHDTGVALI